MSWRDVFRRRPRGPSDSCRYELAGGRTVVFVHIVKTGGTSVRRALGLGEKVHRTVREIRAVLTDDEWATEGRPDTFFDKQAHRMIIGPVACVCH